MFKKALFGIGCAAIILVTGFFIHSSAVRAQDLSPSERAELERQYEELQREIAAQQEIIRQTQAKKNTLQGDVTLLNAQIRAAQAKIDAKNIQIRRLSEQIAQKNVVIGQLSARIERGKESLAAIMRQRQMLDEHDAVTVALGAQSVSEFFKDLDAFTSVEREMHVVFSDIRDARVQTESEKANLAARQRETADAKYEVVTEQQRIAGDKTEKQRLLALTANQEAEYQKVLAERQAKAAQIRAALFPLRDAAAIQFGDALRYAQAAERATGVPPALMLAVLTQESNLGKNVGQCYLRDNATGAGVGKNTGTPFEKVMAPVRDVPYFLELGKLLGFDPHTQVVSCPIQGVVGWGGAMGPAQFIPSTWKLYAARVAAARGVSVANPWDPADAITAMAYLLADNGAAGGYSAMHTAAAKYYAGGAWATAGQAYANQVMAKVASIQNNIDFLAEN